MSVPSDTSLEVEPMLAWLQAEPDADAGKELLAVHKHWHALGGLAVTPEDMPDLLGLFFGRAFDLLGRFRAILTETSLPLPRALRREVRGLVDSCVDLAGAYLGLARESAVDRALSELLGDEFLGARALDLVGEAWVVGAMGGMGPRYDLWGTAHRLFLALGRPENGLPRVAQDNRTLRSYKRLLALAVIQPEGSSAREIGWVADFLDEQAGEAQLEPLEPGCSGGYWIDPAQDAAPIAVTRRSPPPVEGLLHLNTAPLGRVVTTCLEALTRNSEETLTDAGEAVVAVTVEADLPEGLTVHELVPLLRRLRQHWAMPPLRERPRRRQQYTAEVCLGLQSIWKLNREGEVAAQVTEWEVVNEGPGGFALASTAETDLALSAGMAVAVRRKGSVGWSLGVVRWIRTETPSQVEVGLQLVANEAIPVTLGIHRDQVPEMVHGMLLQPMGEVRRHQAILAPAGYSSSRFLFVHEDERLHVAQGRLLSMEVQTPSVDLFQFEVDPSPM
jgi:cyclic-di-GMP-binding protein